MKDLFKSKFDFVEVPDEELTEKQLEIKRLYKSTYPEPVEQIEVKDAKVVSKEKK